MLYTILSFDRSRKKYFFIKRTENCHYIGLDGPHFNLGNIAGRYLIKTGEKVSECLAVNDRRLFRFQLWELRPFKKGGDIYT